MIPSFESRSCWNFGISSQLVFPITYQVVSTMDRASGGGGSGGDGGSSRCLVFHIVAYNDTD